jgi:hypothetical protein
MKKIMDVLPRYIDIRNKNDSNNQECITVNALQNRFDVFVPQKDEKGANNVGRGITTPVFGNDEGPFISWIEKSLQAALPGMSAAIEDAKKAPVLKQDTTKSPEQKLAEEKKKIEQKKKSELEKKLAEQNAAKNAEKEKAQQEKKVNELVTSEKE